MLTIGCGGYRYNTTKLLELFYVRELAKNLDAGKHGVVANVVNPGMCYSEFDRELSWPMRKVLAVMQLVVARQTVDGARVLVWPTTAGLEGHGQYSADSRFSEYVPFHNSI